MRAPVRNDLQGIEASRQQELERYGVLDTAPEQAFDDIALLASMVCKTPIALVSLVDSQREWFKSRIGILPAELPRFRSFCSKAIETPDDVMIINDARATPQFAVNALVNGTAEVRFYAGAPLVTARGQALGTVCVMDREPRALKPTQVDALRALARQVVAQLELRRIVNELSYSKRRLTRSHRALERREGRLAQLNAELESANRIDALTGAGNRRAFDEFIEAAIDRAASRTEPLSLVMFDVDHFKTVNDELGHSAGDNVLRNVAERLQAQARKGDFVARFGGEEFAVICPGSTEQQAHSVADRLRRAVEETDCEGRRVTVSAGVASLSIDALTSHEVIEAADRALYRAKQAGRNTVVKFSDSNPLNPSPPGLDA